MDRTSGRSGLPPEIGVFALVAAASLPLARLFRPPEPDQTGYGQVQLYALVAGVLIAWGLRRLRLPVLISAAISAGAFFWFAGALFVPRTLAGPFPAPETVSSVLSFLRTGLKLSNTDVAPVAAVPHFLSLAALGIWATMWLADDAAVRLRHPLLAIGLTLPVFAMPGTLLRGGHSWAEVAIFIAAALLVMFQDERSRLARWAGAAPRKWQSGLAARIGAVAVVLGIVSAPLLPGYGQAPGGSLRAGRNGRITVNPLVSIKPSLNHFPAVNLFQVRAPGPGYWRLTALDRFNGTVWTASTQSRTLSLGREVRRSSLAPVVDRVEQRIRIENLAGPWVPGEFEAVWVRGIKGVGLEPVTRTLVTSRGFRTGDEFSVISDVAVPSGDDLEQDDGPDPAGDQYLALPGTTPPIVRNVALFVTARAGTKLEKAIALQDYLRTFDYDLNVALHHSYSDLVRFLTDVRAGYCEQFAAAMAVMARSIGIPARVAIGFGSGDLASSNTYEVTSQHAHAWVEIHFPTYGWMAFEPTPRTDGFDVPRYARFAPGAAQPTAAPSVTPPTTTPTPTPSGEARAERPDAGTPSATGSSARGWLLVPIAAAVLLALLTAALPVPATTRRVLRRRRARTPPQVVGVRYVEFLEWCRAAALGRHPSETPVEHARRLAARPSVAARPLDDLAALATAAVYAGDGNAIEPGAVAARAAAARKAVAPSVSRARRILPVIGWGWWNAEDAARNKRRR